MGLITDVTEKIEAQFKRLWPYQSENEFARVKQLGAEYKRFEELSAISAIPEAERSTEQREKYDSEVKKAEAHQKRQEERGGVQGAVCEAITDQLNRLTPDSFPREDPEVAKDMVDFLTRFGRSYTKEGKQRSAGPILEYLLSMDYPYAFWLWRQWIAALIATGDLESADLLIAAATDGSTPASHHFATRGGSWKPSFMIAKAQIVLMRDGDLKLAASIVENARLTFSGSREVSEAYKRLSVVQRKVDAGELRLEIGKNSASGLYEIKDKDALEEDFSPTFLLECRT